MAASLQMCKCDFLLCEGLKEPAPTFLGYSRWRSTSYSCREFSTILNGAFVPPK